MKAPRVKKAQVFSACFHLNVSVQYYKALSVQEFKTCDVC